MFVDPRTVRGEMQRLTGRQYQIKVEDMDAQSRQELLRFIRDAQAEIASTKRKVRTQPWRYFR